MLKWIKRRRLLSKAKALFDRAVFLQCHDVEIKDLREEGGFFFLGYDKERVWLRSESNHLAYILLKDIHLERRVLSLWESRLDAWEDSFFHVDTLSRITRLKAAAEKHLKQEEMPIFLSDRPDMVKAPARSLMWGKVDHVTPNSHCIWHYITPETTIRTKVYLPLAVILPEENYLANSSASRNA